MAIKNFVTLAAEDLPDVAHDIGGSDHNRYAGDDSHQPLRPPHAHENGKLCHEAGEAGHAHGDQTANDETDHGERHDLAHPAELRDLAGVGTVVDHAGDG